MDNQQPRVAIGTVIFPDEPKPTFKIPQPTFAEWMDILADGTSAASKAMHDFLEPHFAELSKALDKIIVAFDAMETPQQRAKADVQQKRRAWIKHRGKL